MSSVVKKQTLIFDYNNLAFRTIFTKDVGITTPNPDFQTWRYLTFNSIYLAMNKYKYISEVILAMDDNKTWRKLFFPRYKETRKKARKKKQDVDWTTMYENFNGLAYDIKTHLPIKVLKVSQCEADDVIGILSLKQIKNDIIVVSNDEDYKQLLVKKNVRVYDPRKMKYMECDDPDMFIVEKCLLGQKKDDIFNILTPSDYGQTPETEGKRKPGFGPAALKKVMAYEGGWEKWLKDKNLENRFHKRNKILMDFNKIPLSVRNNITKAYNGYEYPNADNIHKFFKKNHFRAFLDDYTRVENKLLSLY